MKEIFLQAKRSLNYDHEFLMGLKPETCLLLTWMVIALLCLVPRPSSCDHPAEERAREGKTTNN